MQPSELQSTTSSTSSSQREDTREFSSSSKLDLLFPLFDQINQYAPLPQAIVFLFSCYTYLQIIYSCLWSVDPYYGRSTASYDSVQDFIKIGGKLFWWLAKGATLNEFIVPLVACVVLVIVPFIFIITVVIYYYQTRKFIKWTLYPVNFMVTCLSQILMHPIACLIGAGLKYCFTRYDILYLVFVIVLIIIFAVNIFLYFIGIAFTSKSVYLHLSPTSMWDYKPFFQFMLISSISSIAMIIFTIYGEWCSACVEVCHLALIIYIFYRLYYHPFHLIFFNVLLMSIIIGSVATDIFLFVATIMNAKMFAFIPIIVFFSVFIISLPFNGFILYRHKKVATMHLKTKNGDDDSINFDDMRLLENPLKAEFYFRTGFTELSDRFLDWSLLKYYNQNIPEISFTTIQILSFFPSEWRSLNLIYHVCTSHANISYLNRFLLFEVMKLKTLRQYSSSRVALDKISQMKMQTNQIESMVRSMWKAKTFSIKQFEDYAMRCIDMKSIYEEGMINYPNNAKICDEYTQFLVECETDFLKAIQTCSRAQLIEEGHSFIKDICFKLMVKAFPFYVKKNIVDPHGNFIKRAKTEKGSSSSSNNHRASSSTGIESQLNLEIEEQIGRQLLTYGKQRIALNHAVKGRQLTQYEFMKYFTLITLVINIVIFIAIYVFITDAFITRKDSTDGTLIASQLRFYCGLSISSGILKWAIASGRRPDTSVLDGAVAFDGDRFVYFDDKVPYDSLMDKYMMQTRQLLQDFITMISDYGAKGVDTSILAAKVTRRESKTSKCLHGNVIGTANRSIMSLMDSFFVSIAKLAANNDSTSAWYTSDDFCDASNNYESLIIELIGLFTSIDQYQKTYRESLSKELLFLVVIVTIAVLLWNLIPLLVNIFSFTRQIKSLMKIIINLDKKAKENAARKITKSSDSDDFIDISSNEEIAKPPIIALFVSLAVFLGVGLGTLMLGLVLNADEVNIEIQNMNYWLNYATTRISYTVEAFFCTFDAIFLNGSFVQLFTNQSIRSRDAIAYTQMAQKYNMALLTGTDDAPSVLGYDEEFDSINTGSSCEPVTGALQLHSMYLCASTNGAVDIFADLVTQIVKDPEAYHGQISNFTTLNLIHMSSVHLWAFMWKAAERLNALATVAYNRLCNQSLGIMIGSILVSLLLMLVNFAIMHYMKLITDTLFILIRRVYPLDLINNKELLNFLLKQKDDGISSTMNLSQAVLHQSCDGLLMASLNGTIESVNPAVTSILGFKPEQLLGQSAGSIFTPEDVKTVEAQMTMMAHKESGTIYEDHLICMNDSGIEVPCFVSILLMLDQHTGNPHSFITLIRDESELVKMQKEAEESKEKSERLLYQILPRDVVIKLNSGEKEISFSVPSASIIFIDIQRFSEYSSGLTPSDIMMHLSTVFAAFDQQAAKYPLITKIKLIGDDYMAASGLFMKEDDQPSQHAEQILKFALDALSALDEVNLKMNSSLQVRIGVNSGGPLIAGVLGTDKPVFDIIGDPINIAARLQTTDICGKVHISQNTFDLIQGMDFACEPRGEVYLKGKGKTNTYFVVPMSGFALSSASIIGVLSNAGNHPIL